MYDCEIINLIAPNNLSYNDKFDYKNGWLTDCDGYRYCDSWQDFEHMGISVIGTWRNYDTLNLFGRSVVIPLPFGKYEAFVNHNNFMGDIETTSNFSTV